MDGATGIVYDKNEKVLLVKRRDVPVWVFPGGGIEEGETPEQAVIREVWEESGFKVRIKRKIAEYTYQANSRITYVFECEVVSGTAQTSNESKEVAFFAIDDLPELRHPYLNQQLNDALLRSKVIIKKEIMQVTPQEIFKKFFAHPVIIIRYLLLKVGLRINT